LAEAFNNAQLGTLIEIQNVQFADGSVGRKFYDVDSGGGATNHSIISALTPPVGNEGVVRFSSFASFADEIIPSGSGTIRGVLTKFGSTFQFMIRSTSDINMEG